MLRYGLLKSETDPWSSPFLTINSIFMSKHILLVALLGLSTVLSAQETGTLYGLITMDSEAVVGANIILKGSSNIAVTDIDGKYELVNIPLGKQMIEVSYIGQMISQSLSIKAGRNEFNTELAPVQLNAITIDGIRVEEGAPITYTNMDKEAIEQNNLGQDVPFLLKWTPSTVVTSDAGAGIGYTGIRIRGSDPSRTNVTLNGVPLNDSESQETFWVDLPDFASSTNSIQIQRGVGTSTNGAGAFGASINLQTNSLKRNPYAIVGTTVGSFNTLKANVQAGTGLINNKFALDARMSRISSDGYIDRASSDLESFFLSGTYLGKNASLKLNVFSGHEVTYQAWYGTDPATVKSDRTYNVAGIKADGSFHDNQVDDYIQSHYQAIYNQTIADWNLNLTGHYTRGEGFYEEYKIEEDLADYAIADITIAAETITSSDLIRRRWLDNHFYGAIFNLSKNGDKIDHIIGGGFNQYLGRHFGEVTWSRFAGNSEINHVYYDNDATKNDLNLFYKMTYRFQDNFSGYLDLQIRNVNYEFLGFDNDGSNITQDAALTFFNPKVGLNYRLQNGSSLYAYFGIANREPNRSDYTESTPTSRPEQETLYNTELGYKKNGASSAFAANIYYMSYKNQLALTGQINDVGENTRTNIDQSYRLGLEVEGGIEISKGLTLTGNATFSQNKVVEWTEYVDNWDTWGQDPVDHKDTDLSFSPSIIGALSLDYEVFYTNIQSLDLGLSSKYVGEQFIDNTSNDATKLDAYSYADFRIGYTVKPKFVEEIRLTFLAKNIFNQLYVNNAWSYHYSSAGASDYFLGYYPQAGRNFLLGATIKF